LVQSQNQGPQGFAGLLLVKGDAGAVDENGKMQAGGRATEWGHGEPAWRETARFVRDSADARELGMKAGAKKKEDREARRGEKIRASPAGRELGDAFGILGERWRWWLNLGWMPWRRWRSLPVAGAKGFCDGNRAHT